MNGGQVDVHRSPPVFRGAGPLNNVLLTYLRFRGGPWKHPPGEPWTSTVTTVRHREEGESEMPADPVSDQHDAAAEDVARRVAPLLRAGWRKRDLDTEEPFALGGWAAFIGKDHADEAMWHIPLACEHLTNPRPKFGMRAYPGVAYCERCYRKACAAITPSGKCDWCGKITAGCDVLRLVYGSLVIVGSGCGACEARLLAGS